jgi:hypothetical protein
MMDHTSKRQPRMTVTRRILKNGKERAFRSEEMPCQSMVITTTTRIAVSVSTAVRISSAIVSDQGQAEASAMTGLLREPRPAMVTSTVSPGDSGLTPAGVPVRRTSPGSSVITEEAKATNW